MSLLPEFIFRATLVRGIRTIRQDNRFLDQLFRNLDQESAAEMRRFFQDQKIYIDINYPREALKLPAIIILLKQENEDTAFLGDTMGVDSMPDALSYDSHEDSELEVLGGAATLSSLSGQGPLIFGPFAVLSATNNTLKIASEEWSNDQYRIGVHQVNIIGGRGLGQQRTITANGCDTLMVDRNWTLVPDTTSVFEIRQPADEVIGQPRSVYTREEARVTERLGSLYGLTYQIQIIGPNPEITIYLHAIVKFIFTLMRTWLEGQGIINMKLGATDFVPRAEYQPDFAYMRALNVAFLYPFDVFAGLGDLAQTLRLVLEQDCDVNLSDTTV